MRRDLYKDLYDLEEKHWWHISKRKTCVELIKKYKKRAGNRILDIGCGSGKNLEQFSIFGSLYGIDISKEAIKFCKKRGLVNAKLGNSYHTGFKSSFFDIVTLLDVLEHTDDKRTLYEIKRILRQNGLLIITVPAFDFLWSRWDEVLHHKRRYTQESLRRILVHEGFEIIKISYVYSFLVLPAVVIRAIKSILFKENYPSDFKLSTNYINKLMLLISSIERRFMNNIDIPFGTSLVCICVKK